jgi:diguanylate cyclase (GGDEF)-like protein/PAS domain S-box-containing protein
MLPSSIPAPDVALDETDEHPLARISLVRRAAWILLLVILPLTAALSLQALNLSTRQNSRAALDLQTLGTDLNGAAAEMAWAVGQGLAPQSVASQIRADVALVGSDITTLRSDGVDDPGVLAAERASTTFLSTVQRALTFLGTDTPKRTTPSVSAILAAQTQHNTAESSIEAASDSLAAQAASADVFAEVGTWTIVVLLSTALLTMVWRAEQRGRRDAVLHERRSTLEHSERTFRLLFDRNPAPMWTYDPETLRFLTVNRAAMATYGYSREEFLNMTILDIRPVADRQAFRTSASMGLPRPAKLNARHLRRDGRVIDVEVTADDLAADGPASTLVLARDVTDERQLETELRERAFHDALTGLPNRALLADRFGHAQAVRARENRDLAMVIIDLDDFKRINDAVGHTVGDEVLRSVAARLRAVVRPQDTVARLGGDEFAILLDGRDLLGTIDLGARVVAAFAVPFDADGSSIEVTACAGLVAIETREVTWDEALQRAYIAMFEAKAAGKATLKVYELGMRSGVLDRLDLAADLEHALAHDELVLYYQPIVATNRPASVEHVEALARWVHPTRGLVAPDDFIPLAEQTGLIVPLGAWVLRTACAQVGAWEALGRRLSVSVNVSGRQLVEPAFAASVVNALTDTGLAASRLTLEITETAMLEDLEKATRELETLRDLGVQVALDDFGAGYSSLSYLDRLPVDVVKIDRAFIADLDSADRRATLRAITSLLNTMKVRTVAEGIETLAQFAYVKSLGIDACQGYLFSRPLPAIDVLDAVRFDDSRTSDPVAVA